jgi:hypothetical protein
MKLKTKTTEKISLENIDLDMLKEYIERGPGDTLPPEYNRYLELLDKIRSMHQRYDKFGNPDLIINHLVKYEGLDKLKARQMHNEALDYFFAENGISKQAFRNIYADKVDRMINAAILMVKDVSDFAKVEKMIEGAFKMRGLDVPDPEKLPDELFDKKYILYTINAADVGMPAIDRNKLASLIDEKVPGLTEWHKDVLKRDAGLLPYKAFPDEQNDQRKN